LGSSLLAKDSGIPSRVLVDDLSKILSGRILRSSSYNFLGVLSNLTISA